MSKNDGRSMTRESDGRIGEKDSQPSSQHQNLLCLRPRMPYHRSLMCGLFLYFESVCFRFCMSV